MTVLELKRFLLATIAATAAGSCGSTGDCSPTTTVYALSLLADAGPADSGGSDGGVTSPDGGVGSCEEACKRLGGEFTYVESCHFGTLVERDGRSVPAVACKGGSLCEGRRPQGYRPSGASEHFAIAAELEAASVSAFAQLARELRHHRAPRRLIQAARRARRDELRHARATAALARMHGAHPSPRVAPGPIAVRDLEAIAVENAVEGCVRETFGAATAWYRALYGRDPVVRAAYLRIARDETGHAALARAVDRWATARLSRAARERVARARIDAVAELRAQVLAAGRSELVPDPIAAAQWIAAIGAINGA